MNSQEFHLNYLICLRAGDFFYSGFTERKFREGSNKERISNLAVLVCFRI